MLWPSGRRNSYCQNFYKEERFVAGASGEASELVQFRNPIGTEGLEIIMQGSTRIQEDDTKNDKDETRHGSK